MKKIFFLKMSMYTMTNFEHRTNACIIVFYSCYDIIKYEIFYKYLSVLVS